MTDKLKLLSLLLLSGTLAACGGGDGGGDDPGGSSSSSSSAGNGSSSSSSCGPVGCVGDLPETQLEIVNEQLPLIEQFQVNAGEGENRAEYFFSPEYMKLNSPTPQTVTKDGEEVTILDEHPSFYYPTCCFWETNEETGERTGNLVPELDYRFNVRDGKMALSNARFTIGQLKSDLVTEEASDDNDRKTETTDVTTGSSWGELDLSEPYRISMCINDAGPTGTGNSNLEVYVDNNSGGNEAESIHATASTLLRHAITEVPAGNRLVIEVPGDVFMADDAGEPINEAPIAVIPEAASGGPVGTEHSYLQFRVSSGGYVVMSDLVIEKQTTNTAVSQGYTCEADTEFWEHAPEPTREGVAFEGLSVDNPFEINYDGMTVPQFSGEEGTDFLAFPHELTQPFYEINSSENIEITDAGLHFWDNRFNVGDRTMVETSADSLPQGAIDLSSPYQISFDVVETNGEGNFQIYVDNNTTSMDNSMHEGASRLRSGPLTAAPGETVTIQSDVGTAESFLQFRCDSSCDVTIDNIQVSYQGDGPAEQAWTPSAMPLIGDPDAEPVGILTEATEDSVTFTASGGKVNSSNFSFWMAYDMIEMSDFVFTARVAELTAPESGDNGYRFGMMALTGIEPAETFAELPAYADIGFYMTEDEVPVLQGSRSQMKGPGEGRSRSDIDGIGEGSWLRMEIKDTEDGEGKRITWYVSSDGENWTEESSKTTINDDGEADFRATADDDTWYVGFYGAPGEDERVTMTFDNITVAPLAATP